MVSKYTSALVDPNSTSSIAAQMVTGIGFLGAGIILNGELFDNNDSNNPLNRKAVSLIISTSIWFAAAIGMAIGFNFYFIVIITIAFAAMVPRTPQVRKKREKADY